MNNQAAFMQNANQYERDAMMNMLQDMQVQDSLRLFNGVVQLCFGQCVNSFYTESMSDKETKCVARCTEKYIKHTMRCSGKFQELNEAQQKTIAANQ